ncbi:MAG TPA: DUF1353 domain-containing protein [Egibacteraceae bacterium]|jgi:hypothetical protein|nr:DUF1353 domain-containing protein [Egibacteraceae bacterium]
MLEQGYYAADKDAPAKFVLQRVDGRDGTYLLTNQFRYVHEDGRIWTIPARLEEEFETDLASVPTFAAWLVPKDGRHTPAALVHDAMILDPGEKPNYLGPQVGAEEADRIFREAMQYLGVKFLRRWVMWGAVSVRTLMKGEGRNPIADRVRVMVGLFAFSVMGLFLLPAVLDFPTLASYSFVPDSIPGLRVLARGVKFLWDVEEATFSRELLHFAGVGGLGTLLYAATWFRRFRFGLVLGPSLALTAWPMAVAVVSYGIYWLIEELIALLLLVFGRRRERVPSSRVVQRLAGG